MKYYTPQHKQLALDLVRSSLDNLDKSNRRVQMGAFLPWADIEKEYNSRLDNRENVCTSVFVAQHSFSGH